MEQGGRTRAYGRHRVVARHFTDLATALVNSYIQQACGVMGGQVVQASRWQGRGGLGAGGCCSCAASRKPGRCPLCQER